MEDSLQLKRLTCVIDGYVDQHDIAYDGMLSKYNKTKTQAKMTV